MIAVAVAVLVLLFSFMRLWRENAGGANSNLVFFFLRSLFFFGLVGSSVWIIGQMAATGREIAEGDEINGTAGRAMLFEFYRAQRDSFNESYQKLVMGTFTVQVDGREMGQVYEGVSAAMSQFAGMIIGTGVEAYSATAAASINQLAQNTQAQGSYDAQTTEARASRESGMLRNQAAFISGKAQALSSAQAGAGAAMAAGRAGVSQAYTMFGSASRGGVGYNEQMAQISTQRSIRDNNVTSTRQASETNTDSQVGRKQEWSRGLGNIPLFGGPIDLIREGVSGTVSSVSGGKYGAMPLTLHQRGYDAARIEYTSGVNANASRSFNEAQRVERQTGDRMAAISTQQGKEAAGAAYAAAGTSVAGHQAALGINNQASQIDFSGRMNSANLIQNAAVESAKLQAIATIISRMGSKLAQDIEKGLEMRY